MENINIFWFRRDLRLDDNTALSKALNSNLKCLPIFIFDEEIISKLNIDDSRVSFIYDSIVNIKNILHNYNKSLLVRKGKPTNIFKELIDTYNINKVYTNEDYEPYAIKRDTEIKKLLNKHNVKLEFYKDQVIFAKNDILKQDGKPYSVFSAYKRKWLEKFNALNLNHDPKIDFNNFISLKFNFPSLNNLGFIKSSTKAEDFNISNLENYATDRDIPSLNSTSKLSVHLRFGTISIRKLYKEVKDNEVFLSELIWREFFMQILFHFPHVVDSCYRSKYNLLKWENNEEHFEKWKEGKTGYPIVDAGMRELNTTGFMHNRVRMICASFLCKHLLIDWRWGEAYFAEKLLDYELSSNNGNWQWAASTGCDAVPYFRIFNPSLQQKKFDPELTYVKRHLPEWNTPDYPSEIVDHKFARERAIYTYKSC
ncbi:MAG: DNA photolyase family protein [Marinifilaceae bacterium]|jgi:deoxyribodipyrimidine photo-lyase|nr:DNA photolyase family protein [Marinifilaceae bacterium]